MNTEIHDLKLPSLIKFNNRKILSGIAEVIGEEDKLIDMTVAIDKLDKIGIDKVKDEMLEKGISSLAVEKLDPIINMQGDVSDKLLTMREVLADSVLGLEGVDEIQKVIDKLVKRTQRIASINVGEGDLSNAKIIDISEMLEVIYGSCTVFSKAVVVANNNFFGVEHV